MARKAREVLEDRFKEKGYAKIWEGNFLLQDQHRRNLDLRRPWKFIMKSGEQRYMSIKFRENMEIQRSCPHCGEENKALEGQATIWRVLQYRCHLIALMKSSQSCQVTYERIVELNKEDTTEDTTPRSSPSEVHPQSPPKHDITEEELKYCFRRLTLTAPAPPISEFGNTRGGNEAVVRRLLDRGMDVMAKNDREMTELESTIMRGMIEVLAQWLSDTIPPQVAAISTTSLTLTA
jgi:hypothetical protein